MTRARSLALMAALGCLAGAGFLAPGTQAADAQDAPLKLQARYRAPVENTDRFEVRRRELDWDPRQTALIICDMWDEHWCRGASRRVGELAPRMNEFVKAARAQGVLIVHSPSSCMEPYAEHSGRKLAQSAPKADNLPADIGQWCRHIPEEEGGKYPLDQSDGGCDCTPMCPHGSPWRRQVAALEIEEGDAISDSGDEIWNLFEARGIQNAMLLGVHTNMCVLGRPFGLRNLVRHGKQVVLVRDLTDTMYNPRSWPYVNHFRGTDLIVEHIEKFVCPTITSDQLLAEGSFRFPADKRPRVVIAISEDEYKTHLTLPKFAADVLEAEQGLETVVLQGDPANPHIIPGLAEALSNADLLLLSVRRRALPADDLEAVRKFLSAGKPLVGIRTASHAFDARGAGPAGHAEWVRFDPEILGGNYHGHHGSELASTISLIESAADHPILAGVETPFTTKASLYQVSPLAQTTTALLSGKAGDHPVEPVAWTNSNGKGRVFYTSLGYVDDFDNPAFVRLLGNAVAWALDQPAAPKEARREAAGRRR